MAERHRLIFDLPRHPHIVLPLAMVRTTNWSRRFKAPIVPLDGEPIKALPDIVSYMDGIGEHRQARRAWHRLAKLLLDAAEHGGDMDEVDRQLRLALLLNGKLDVERTRIERI